MYSERALRISAETWSDLAPSGVGRVGSAVAVAGVVVFVVAGGVERRSGLYWSSP